MKERTINVHEVRIALEITQPRVEDFMQDAQQFGFRTLDLKEITKTEEFIGKFIYSVIHGQIGHRLDSLAVEVDGKILFAIDASLIGKPFTEGREVVTPAHIVNAIAGAIVKAGAEAETRWGKRDESPRTAGALSALRWVADALKEKGLLDDDDLVATVNAVQR